MWRKHNPAKPLLQAWMPDDAIVVQHITERACATTGKTITVQAALMHVDGTLLYQAVKPGAEVIGMKPQFEIASMAWAIKCNAAMLTV